MQKPGIQSGDILIRGRDRFHIEREGCIIYEGYTGVAGVNWERTKIFVEHLAFCAGLNFEQAGPKKENPQFRFIEKSVQTKSIPTEEDMLGIFAGRQGTP